MVIADRHGANPRQIPLRATNFRASLRCSGVHNNNPAWSPDGDWVYFSSGEEPQNEMDVDIWRVRPSGGPAERLTNQHAAANYAVAIDSRRCWHVARDADGGGPWLWSLDVNRKSTSRVSPGVEQYMSISASRDGRRVVATVSNPSSSLWRVPLRAAIATEADAEPHAAGSNRVDTGAALQSRDDVLPVGRRDGRRSLAGRTRACKCGAMSITAVRAGGRVSGRARACGDRQARRQTQYLAHFGERFESTHVGRFNRDSRRGRTGSYRLVARRPVDYCWRPRRAGRRCSRSRLTAAHRADRRRDLSQPRVVSERRSDCVCWPLQCWSGAAAGRSARRHGGGDAAADGSARRYRFVPDGSGLCTGRHPRARLLAARDRHGSTAPVNSAEPRIAHFSM